MANAIRFHEIGTPSVMRWEEIEVGRPGAGEVRVRHEAVGLNFADTYFRSGLYPAQLPAGMGVEGAGVVEEIGEGVVDFAVGDRVTYTGSPLGAYATERIMASSDLIALPDGIAFDHEHGKATVALRGPARRKGGLLGCCWAESGRRNEPGREVRGLPADFGRRTAQAGLGFKQKEIRGLF